MSGADATTDRPFRILALSGGGYLGLYSAAVLAALEEQIGEPIGRRFDLIAGTSVGGITAAAVAFELPLAQLVSFFVEQGKDVFSPRAKPSGAVGRLLDLSRSVLGPKYDHDALRDALDERLGDATFADALHPLVLPAVNVTRSLTKVFKTPHAPASRGDDDVRVAEAVLATCAAPAYFPSVQVGKELYADGGLFAVAPDQVALHEAEHFMGIGLDQVRMLSIGTATVGYRPAEGVDADAGAVGWLSDGRLILTLIAVQQQHVQAMMEDRLGARYLRAGCPVAGRRRFGYRHRDAGRGSDPDRACRADGARVGPQALEAVPVSAQRPLAKRRGAGANAARCAAVRSKRRARLSQTTLHSSKTAGSAMV